VSPTNSINRLAYEVAAKDAAWPVLPIVMADMESGEIVVVNKFVADVFGYEADDLYGQPIEMLVPDALRDSHAQWRRDATVPKARLMGVGRQIMGRRKDGTLFPVHVGLTAMECMGRNIGIAFVIDLTGPVTQAIHTAQQVQQVQQAQQDQQEQHDKPPPVTADGARGKYG
jgi:PAS domain S-box-containing protein